MPVNDIKYERHDIFSAPIFQFENKVLINELKEFILEREISGIESNVAKEIKSNLHESAFDFFQNESQIVLKTRNFVAYCIKKVINDIKDEKFDYELNFSESWYHVGETNSSHDIHNHANCSWCGIYYIQSGDPDSGGQTFFQNPINSIYKDYGTDHIEKSAIAITPSDGLLVIFPSILNHYQALYTGKMKRIVVAFNTRVLGKV
tara:strand:+ start:128 stop:742 length:615 start_codon:yes stop_codon:yes gene_type:complete